MPQSGSHRKRKWKDNKRREGWTNSMIQPGHTSRGNSGHLVRGGIGGLSSHVVSSSGASSTGSRTTTSGGRAAGRRSAKLRGLLFGSGRTANSLAKHETALLDAFDQALDNWGVSDTDLQLLPELEIFLDLNPKYTRIYSNTGVDYGMRGGQVYIKPKCWRRFGVRTPEFHERGLDKWAIAYHGTTRSAIKPILVKGLCSPNSRGASAQHGQAFAGENKGNVIYLSPCLGYAAHPVYAQMFELGDEHWAQIVFQCRVDPQRIWKRCPSTLQEEHWPKDVRFAPEFPTHENMEWLVLDSEAIVVYGILLREFGKGADPAIYGNLTPSVNDTEGAVEYTWTRMLRSEYRRLGLTVDCAEATARSPKRTAALL